MNSNECAYCSLNELDHDRGMMLVHPLMRHAFIENVPPRLGENASESDTAGIQFRRRNTEIDTERDKISEAVSSGRAVRQRTIDPRKLVQLDAKSHKFSLLGSLTAGEESMPGSILDTLAKTYFGEPKEEEEATPGTQTTPTAPAESTPSSIADVLQSGDIDSAIKEQDSALEKRMNDPQYKRRYVQWQTALGKHFTPTNALQDPETGHIFEVYSTSEGQRLIIGPDGHLTEHEMARAAGPVAEGEHALRQHRTTGAGKIVDSLTGRDIAIAQGREVRGPELPRFERAYNTDGTPRLDSQGVQIVEKTPAEKDEAIRSAIQGWAKQNGTTSDAYLTSLAQRHSEIGPHHHRPQSRNVAMYEIGDDGMLRSTPDRELGFTTSPLAYVHNVLLRAGDVPMSTVGQE